MPLSPLLRPKCWKHFVHTPSHTLYPICLEIKLSLTSKYVHMQTFSNTPTDMTLLQSSIISNLEYCISLLIGPPTSDLVSNHLLPINHHWDPKTCQNTSRLWSRSSNGFPYYSLKTPTFYNWPQALNYSGFLLPLWPILPSSLSEHITQEALCHSWLFPPPQHFSSRSWLTLTSFSTLWVWQFPAKVFCKPPEVTTPTALCHPATCLFSTIVPLAKWHTMDVYLFIV